MLRRVFACTLAMAAASFAPAVPGQEWSVPLYDTATEGRVNHHRAQSVLFMPDGKSVVTGGYYFEVDTQSFTAEVRFFDTATGKLTDELKRPDAAYSMSSNNIAMSPEGQRIAVGGWQGKYDPATRKRLVDVWDVDRRQLSASFPIGPESGAVFCIDFSQTDPSFAVATASGQIMVIDLMTMNKRWDLPKIGCHVAYSPDGKTLAVGSTADGRISVLDATGGTRRGRFPLTIQREADSRKESNGPVAFSRDGRFLAGAIFPEPFEGSGVIRVCRLVERRGRGEWTGLGTFEFAGHGPANHIYCIAFSPDGKMLASGAQDNCVRLWDVSTQKELAAIDSHKDFVYGLRFSPNGNGLVSVSRDSLQYRSLAGVPAQSD